MGKIKKTKKRSFLQHQRKHMSEKKTDQLKSDSGKFKYASFAEEVSKLDSSIVYKLAGIGKIQECSETSSLLHQTLEHWRELNLTVNFVACCKKLGKYVNLTQVVFGQLAVIDVLKDHLSAGTPLDLQPVLELVAALATDLQHEFYPHLQEFLDMLMGKPLAIKDPEVIKWTEKCIGHLLKVLWKPISENLHTVYNWFVPIFSTSRPDYIRYLTADTVAFLLRKCGDKPSFVRHIVESMTDATDPLAVAKVLVEAVKTANGQFSSHVATLWPIYLEVLTTGGRGQVLIGVFDFVGQHTNSDYCGPIFDMTFTAIREFSEGGNVTGLKECLKALGTLVDAKLGSLVKRSDKLVKLLVDLGGQGCCLDEYLEVSTKVLKAVNIILSDAEISSLISLTLDLQSVSLTQKLSFVTNFLDHGIFESHMLIAYLKLIQENFSEAKENILDHLAETIRLKSPPCEMGSDLRIWQPFILDFHIVPSLRKIPKEQILSSIIIEEFDQEESMDEKQLQNILVCLSSLKPMDKNVIQAKISKLITRTFESTSLLPLLPLMIETLIHLTLPTQLPEFLKPEAIFQIFLANPSVKSNIQSLDYLCTCLGGSLAVDLETVRKVLPSLVDHLSCSDAGIRQMSLHLLTVLVPMLGNHLTKVTEERPMSMLGVLQTLLAAERLPENLASYREKVQQLQRIDIERLADFLMMEKDAENNDEIVLSSAPLQYLLGSLYTNFTLMWEPLMGLIAGYAGAMETNSFWNIFRKKLVAANADIVKLLQNGVEIVDGNRVNFIGYRNNLWTIMSKCPRVAEKKNREVVGLFLDDFIKIEYQEIGKLSEDKEADRTIVITRVKSLLSHLEVFALFKDLKSLHRQAELRALVDTFLVHRIPQVQKLALDILVAFKLKFLVPYKENLNRLLEEKDFKAELLAFPLIGQDTPIKDEHREGLMPILLRMLYGRLRAKKNGKKQGGKGAVAARKSLILRHLMEIPEEELQLFFNCVFGELYAGIEDGTDILDYVCDSSNTLLVESPKQLQSAIEMIEIIINKLGKSLDGCLPYLVKTTIWLGCLVQNQLSIGSHKSAQLKDLRNGVFAQLSMFFTEYPGYSWSDSETKAIFHVFVWKMLDKFDTDFIHSSSGLLKLLLSWSKQSKHRHLLAVKHPENGSRILQAVTKVLLKQTTGAKVIDGVLDLVHNLVMVDQVEEIMMTDTTVCGIEIVLPEMDTILEHFKTWIEVTKEDVKKAQKVEKKLEILSSLAEHVKDPEVAFQFIKQLLPLSTELKKTESVLQILKVVQGLAVHDFDDSKRKDIMNELLPLFGKMNTRLERVDLCLIVEKMSNDNKELERLASFCCDMNSYDKRYIEEPDFKRRIESFKKLRDIAKAGDLLTVAEVKALLYNCCHFLRKETDSSLKTSAQGALENLTAIMAEMFKTEPDQIKTIIEKICITQIRAGLRDKDDIIRCDFLSYLHGLVKQCADIHPRLKDLAKLISEDDDMDSGDFFENMKHMQLHRRGRVMSKLAKQLAADTGFLQVKTLTQVILPLCSSYLMNPTYVKNSDMVEQAIELLASICRALPWQQYEQNCKFYIDLFTKETAHGNQLVKITTAILDAFHFDISENEGDTEKEKLQKERICNTFNKVLLPMLHKTLSGKQKGPAELSLSDEDKLIQRVPLSIPIINILKLMSTKLVEQAVPGIIAKITSFLKSKAVEIRVAARDTLCKVVELLGARFLSFVLTELGSILQRGYQLHILTYTVHTLLHHMSSKEMLSPGQLNSTASTIMNISMGEMFGVVAEEKDVAKITSKLIEARGTKSYDTIQLLARYVSNDALMILVEPLANKLKQLSTHKNIVKIRECYRQMVLGLLDNTGLDPVHCLVLIYGVLTDQLKVGGMGQNKWENRPKKEEEKSCLIVQRAPSRKGLTAKKSKTTTFHVLHEFGLNLLYFLLKRSSLRPDCPDHVARLESFLPILIDFLSSGHVSLTTVSLRCLFWLVKMPLKALDQENVRGLTVGVFDLLRKFAGGTDGKGENHDLMIMASKLLVVMIRDVEATTLDDDHLKQVLDYVECDVLDPFKQTTAFGLLSAILQRRLISPQLYDVVHKIAELSVQSPVGQTRQAAGQAVVSYVTSYNIKKKLGNLFDLYAGQLTYELESGRIAALQTLYSIISKLKNKKVEAHASFLFVSLAPIIINDESTACRKQAASVIGVLLKSVTQSSQDTLRNLTMSWYSGDNPSHQQLASHLITIFVTDLGLKSVKPILTQVLAPLPDHLAGGDHLAVQSLNMISKLVTADRTLLSSSKLNSIWLATHQCLLHSHAWVRFLSSQLIGLILSAASPAEVAETAAQSSEDDWLASPATVRSLMLDLIEQLCLPVPEDSDCELGTQAIKNLVALTKITLAEGWGKVIEASENAPTFPWVCGRLIKISNQELVKTPKETGKRSSVFDYIGAVCLDAEPKVVEAVLGMILSPLHRELSNTKGNAELKTQAQDVVDLIKSRVEEDAFNTIYTEIQLKNAKKKGERKEQRKQDLILHPQKAVKRKITQNLAKKGAKKAKAKEHAIKNNKNKY